MATWVALIVETRGRTDFWALAARHGVQPKSPDASVPSHALIDCPAGGDWELPLRLAESLSRELSGYALGFAIQTNSDVHVHHAFASGERVRRLDYSRDEGGWTAVEGRVQPWERLYFFDPQGSTTDEGAPWPDMLDDELTDEELARYEEARRSGDPSRAMELFNPSSTFPMIRVCESFGLKPDAPTGEWRKPSGFWKRLFGG